MRQKERGHRQLGYFMLVVAVALYLYGWRMGSLAQQLWISILSIGLWAVATLLIVQRKEQKEKFFGIITAVVVLVVSPMAFLYFEAARGIAMYRHGSPIAFVLYEIIAALLFFGSLVFLLRFVSRRKKR